MVSSPNRETYSFDHEMNLVLSLIILPKNDVFTTARRDLIPKLDYPGRVQNYQNDGDDCASYQDSTAAPQHRS